MYWEWGNILIFVIIPVLTVAVMFFAKRKWLWTAPLISLVLAFVTYAIALDIINPAEMIAFLDNNEWRGFLMLALMMHLAIAVAWTLIAYCVAYILKRNLKRKR